MTAILDAIDDALTAYADHLGSPWPGRIPHHREFLAAIFGPEDGYPVPSATEVEVAAIDWATMQVAMLEDCGGGFGECVDHERAFDVAWAPALPQRIAGVMVSFTTRQSQMQFLTIDLSWLAEEDAWLADRATREAATR